MKDRQIHAQSSELRAGHGVADLERNRHTISHLSNGASTEQSYGSSGFVFGFSSNATDLLQLHPSPETMFSLWQIYLENVDPLLKLVHAPSVQRHLIRASHNLAKQNSAQQALMFSIYYAAVMSTPGQKPQPDLQEDRSVLLERYRFGLEQALARADFLATQDVTVLQAFVLYLIFVRRDSKGPDVWTLTSLAIRIATRMGLHQDEFGRASTLSHFQIEIRRRLWWQICILDVRTAEDGRSDPSMYELMFSTELPSNVNDADLDPSMGVPRTELCRHTEMLFSLIRFEVGFAVRKILFSRRFCECNSYPLMDAKGQLRFIDELQRRLEDTYLTSCDINIPICFLTLSAVKLVIQILKFTTLLRSLSDSIPPGQATKDALFSVSLGIVENAQALKSDQRVQRWIWLFHDYVEWNAVTYLLHSICERVRGKEVDQAWSAINAVFKTRLGLRVHESKELRWQQLEKLRSKAIDIYGRMLIEEARRVGTGGHTGAIRDATLPDAPTTSTEVNTDTLLSMKSVDAVHNSADFAGWSDPFQDLPIDSDEGSSTFWL